ncbi:hypothetical protein HW555_009615 [Spodoptera exigua]|uniref:Uncharacterized protein n=1 Tax=Spodoptera exigua TaxID=7107 RepID=A0A835L6L5_SPOEX|nr:hypothetical protein HW555_009615 [Spodoptera exigua]
MHRYVTSPSAAPYAASALYTPAPYAPYTPAMAKQPAKDNAQYESSVASSNSLTSTTTQTQTSTAKVATTTVAGHGSSGYASGALYGAGATPYAPYDDQIMRSSLPHHMGGYYEVGYGGRDATFGLSAGERFGRTDAASPQQVPAAALPPGYAYFAYQPPPTTYQYGVYPTYGGGPYSGTASKSAGGAAADLTNAMYAKTHVALNKVNMDVRVNSSHNRRESGAGGGRASASKPAASKPTYSQSYWAPN